MPTTDKTTIDLSNEGLEDAIKEWHDSTEFEAGANWQKQKDSKALSIDSEIKKAIKTASDEWAKGLDARFNEFLQSDKFNIEWLPIFFKQKETIKTLKANHDKLIEALKHAAHTLDKTAYSGEAKDIEQLLNTIEKENE